MTALMQDTASETDESIAALWDQFRTRASAAERNRLAVAYAPIVKFVVGRLASQLRTVAETEDLIGYGMIGLLDAIDRFEPDRGLKFETYASHRIRGAILDEVRRLDWAPRRVRGRIRRVEQTRERMAQELRRQPSDDEITAELGEVAGAARLDASNASVLCLDAPIGDRDGDSIDLRIGSADPGMENVENTLLVRSLLATLTPRDRFIIERYYFDGMALAEIGAELGVTESRVSQLLTRAKRRLSERHGLNATR